MAQSGSCIFKQTGAQGAIVFSGPVWLSGPTFSVWTNRVPGGGFETYTSPDYNDGEWHSIAYSLDAANNLILVFDGTQVDTSIPANSGFDGSGYSNVFRIGAHTLNPAIGFDGIIDQFRFYDRTLTLDELKSLMFK
jgi:hypothetical protein